MGSIEARSNRARLCLRVVALSLLAAALLAQAAVFSPISSPVAAQEVGVEFQKREGVRTDGSGGYLVDATGHSISEGLSTNYFIKLRSQPSANVSVKPVSSSSTVVVNTGSTAPLTFTPQNWSSPQLVQVFTYEGAAAAENAGAISHTVSSDDAGYNGLTPTFTVYVIGTNSNCTASAAPSLTVIGSAENGFSMRVSPTAASCGSTHIIGYDTSIKEDDGPWQTSSNTRAGYPSAWRSSLQPVVHSYEVISGSTYEVKLRGITYRLGPTPWSPLAEVTVAPNSAPEIIDANPGPGGL